MRLLEKIDFEKVIWILLLIVVFLMIFDFREHFIVPYEQLSNFKPDYTPNYDPVRFQTRSDTISPENEKMYFNNLEIPQLNLSKFSAYKQFTKGLYNSGINTRTIF